MTSELENYKRVGKGAKYSTQKEQSMARDVNSLQSQIEKKDKIIGVLEGAVKDVNEMSSGWLSDVNYKTNKALAEVEKIRKGE